MAKRQAIQCAQRRWNGRRGTRGRTGRTGTALCTVQHVPHAIRLVLDTAIKVIRVRDAVEVFAPANNSGNKIKTACPWCQHDLNTSTRVITAKVAIAFTANIQF